MTESYFKQRGFAVAGAVGVLSLVLMVGVIGYAAWSTKFQSKDTSTHAARKEVETIVSTLAEIGLDSKNGKVNVHAKWKAFKKTKPGDKVTISINDYETRKKLPEVSQRLLKVTDTAFDFQDLSLPVGKYFVQLRYVPTEGTVLEQQKDFEITPLLLQDEACLKFGGVINQSGFYSDEKDNRPGNYHLRNQASQLGRNQRFVVYVMDPKKIDAHSKSKITASLNLKGLRGGVDFKSVDGNPGCRATNAGFSCDFDSGAARYMIGNTIPDGFHGEINLNYQIDEGGSLPMLKCGPIPIEVTGPPPP